MDNRQEVPVSKKRNRTAEAANEIATNDALPFSRYHFLADTQSNAAAHEFHQAKARSITPASMLNFQLPPTALNAAGPSYSVLPAYTPTTPPLAGPILHRMAYSAPDQIPDTDDNRCFLFPRT